MVLIMTGEDSKIRTMIYIYINKKGTAKSNSRMDHCSIKAGCPKVRPATFRHPATARRSAMAAPAFPRKTASVSSSGAARPLPLPLADGPGPSLLTASATLPRTQAGLFFAKSSFGFFGGFGLTSSSFSFNLTTLPL
jgi:hypothetical protein